ncbi:hypothetical protein ANO11243_009230 [Dothideomycetidae sp. 11243]|nr:hypothetical protein ANO11243_009230 [fungal sp. No.11243]
MQQSSQPGHCVHSITNPLDLIFSCAVCQRSLKDVYNEEPAHDGTDSGVDLHSPGPGPVKMWITSCAHLICTEHFRERGASFQSRGQCLEAPCPFCEHNYGDKRPSSLYWIKGFGQGQRDPSIPHEWLNVPPSSLDADTAEMEALRVGQGAPWKM